MLGPIFQREWLTLPRRPRHYVTRVAYLGLLWVLGVTAWQAMFGWSYTPTLGDTSRFGPFLFQMYCYVQLTLLLFFAALASASAVAQEKDRRTFLLLLLTDLRDHEIVLGKMLGATLQIGLLLALSIPVMALLLLLGGTSVTQVLQAELVMAATGLAAGSLGCLIALWRDRTFQSLALTVLFIVLYLIIARGIALLPFAHRLEHDLGLNWTAWFDPFLALGSVVTAEQQAVPPALGYTAVMLAICVALNVWAIVKLRRWNPSGEPIMQREAPDEQALEEKDRAAAHAAPGKAREVWDNPILWREIRTRAYGRRPLLVKIAYFVAIGLICWFALAPVFALGPRQDFMAALGLVPVAVLSLLLVSAQAVTAITSERDTGALDLLLVTDISPREFIFGKLGGIAYNCKEYIVPPLLLVLLYAFHGLLATPPADHPEMATYRNVEAYLCITGGLMLLLAFATILGIHVALRHASSRLAVINTLGTIFFLTVGTLICIYLILINGQRFESQLASFVLFLLAGIGGLWWVLNTGRPSPALTLASWLCPIGVLYSITNVLVAKPGTVESTNALMPFVVMATAFGFTLAAMLIPLVSEFDVALGRTTGGGQ